MLKIRKEILAELLAEARRDPRIECCGLLAGREGVISAILPARNALASPDYIAAAATAYEIGPAELFTLFRQIREEKLELVGIYHSHPNTENVPSPTDIERAYYPDAAHFIISPRIDAPRPVRAFRIADGTINELTIEIGETK